MHTVRELQEEIGFNVNVNNLKYAIHGVYDNVYDRLEIFRYWTVYTTTINDNTPTVTKKEAEKSKESEEKAKDDRYFKVGCYAKGKKSDIFRYIENGEKIKFY